MRKNGKSAMGAMDAIAKRFAQAAEVVLTDMGGVHAIECAWHNDAACSCGLSAAVDECKAARRELVELEREVERD